MKARGFAANSAPPLKYAGSGRIPTSLGRIALTFARKTCPDIHPPEGGPTPARAFTRKSLTGAGAF